MYVVQVSFTENIQRHVSCPTIEVQGDSVRDAMEAVFENNPKARGYVFDEHGAVRKHMVIFVNGQPIRDRVHLSDTLSANDEIFVMQALSGG